MAHGELTCTTYLRHTGWSGPITLEIINFGPSKFLLTPMMYICQLIIEEVRGCPIDSPNQLKGQTNPVGERRLKKSHR